MRLIDADALFSGFKKYFADGEKIDNREVCERIEYAPTVDAVPVVRCKDCRYDGSCLTQSFVASEGVIPFDRNTFYCATGKR